MVDSFVEGIQLQVMLVVLATAAVALLIVAVTAWGWWKWKQLARRARRANRASFNRGQDLALSRFAAGGPPDESEVARRYDREVSEETAPPAGGPGAEPGRQPPPRSETRELLEQARRYATQRAQEIGDRLRPEIDRAQQRLEQSSALRDAAARLRSVREAWDRPAAEVGPDTAAPPVEAEAIRQRLDELLEQQRTTNELLRELLERLART